MKGLKKLVLATAVAAAPFAQAEMTAMDDAVLADMTGQSGLTIELSAQVSMGSFTYTDTDQGGTFGMSGVRFGGAGALNGFGDADADNAFDGVKIDIDIDSANGLTIDLRAINGSAVLAGAEVLDFGVNVDNVSMNSLTLASGIQMVGALGPVDIDIANDGKIDVSAFFKITSGAMNIDVLSMGVSNLVIDQDSNPFMTASPFGAEVNAIVGAGDYGTLNNGSAAAGDVAIFDGADGTVADGVVSTAEFVAGGDTDLDGTATVAEIDAVYAGAGAAPAGAVTEGVRQARASGFDDFAYVTMDIQATSGTYTTKAGVSVDTEGLDINITNMSMDITADLTLGEQDIGQTGTFTAASLGSIAIEDLDLSGTSLRIYGH